MDFVFIADFFKRKITKCVVPNVFIWPKDNEIAKKVDSCVISEMLLQSITLTYQ